MFKHSTPSPITRIVGYVAIVWSSTAALVLVASATIHSFH